MAGPFSYNQTDRVFFRALARKMNTLAITIAPSIAVHHRCCCVAVAVTVTVAIFTTAVNDSISATTTARFCCSLQWLVVALLSAIHFRHCMPSCDRQRSRCRPLLPPIIIHRCHDRHRRSSRCRWASTTTTTAIIRGRNHRRPLPKKEAKAAQPSAYQRQHHRENVYESRQLGLI